MADLGNITALKAAINAILNNSVPDLSIEPDDHDGLLNDLLDTITGLDKVLRTNNATGGYNLEITAGDLVRLADSGFFGDIDTATLTDNRTYTFQDASGVVAFLSDLPTVISNHSGLTLDDGTNPHGTTKTDVGLSSVPNTDFTIPVGLNTAKVSADGSIDTHSDVDTTTAAPVIGQALIWNGSNWIPTDAGGGATEVGTGTGSIQKIGDGNNAAAEYSATTGGLNNVINAAAIRSTIAGGDGSAINAAGLYATIGGGGANIVNGRNGTIGGGVSNQVTSRSGTIAGGESCVVNTEYSTVGGGLNNDITAGIRATIAGGELHTITGNYAFIGGGSDNNVTASAAGVCSGALNQSTAIYAFVGGGLSNISSGTYSGILGGRNNSTNTFSDAFIVGSNITADRANTTFVEQLTATGGETILNGAGSTSATTALLVQNSLGTTLFEVKDDGTLIGNYPVSVGTGTDSFTTSNVGSSATGISAIGFGRLAGATADRTIAIGESAAASTSDSVAVGRLSKARGGINATAVGVGTDANAANSLSLASNSRATGTGAIGIGYFSRADGLYSIAQGYQADAFQNYSIGLGANMRADALNAIIIGGSTAAKINSTANSFEVNFNEATSTIRIGQSVDSWINTTANFGIGLNTGISAKAHVKGNGATNATSSLLIENSSNADLLIVRDNGEINASNLPTSSAGLSSGDIWNNAGVLNIV